MSLPARRAKKRDANEAQIVQALRRAGVRVWHMDSPADLLCGHRGAFCTVEVKDGAKPLSARKLTAAEADYAAECRDRGLPHHVVTSVEEALQLWWPA